MSVRSDSGDRYHFLLRAREAVTRRLPAGIGVVEGIAGGTDALRPVHVCQGLDRRPAIDTDDGKPMETAISTIPVKGHVHDIAVSRNGEHAYVALSKSVAVLNGEHRVVASIPLPDHPKNLLMDADGKQLIVSQRGGSASVVDTDTYTVKTLRDRCRFGCGGQPGRTLPLRCPSPGLR